MAQWHIGIDLIQQRDRPSGVAPWLYFRAKYWRSEAERTGGDPPVVTNDFKAGDMLRWIGEDRVEKRVRSDGPSGEGEFFCSGHGAFRELTHTPHWVPGSQKYGLIPIPEDNNNLHPTRVHWPQRFVAGTYTAENVREWMWEQAEDWITLHPGATGDRTDPDLAVEVPGARAKLPAVVRLENLKRRDVTVTDGVLKRPNRSLSVDVTGDRSRQ